MSKSGLETKLRQDITQEHHNTIEDALVLRIDEFTHLHLFSNISYVFFSLSKTIIGLEVFRTSSSELLPAISVSERVEHQVKELTKLFIVHDRTKTIVSYAFMNKSTNSIFLTFHVLSEDVKLTVIVSTLHLTVHGSSVRTLVFIGPFLSIGNLRLKSLFIRHLMACHNIVSFHFSRMSTIEIYIRELVVTRGHELIIKFSFLLVFLGFSIMRNCSIKRKKIVSFSLFRRKSKRSSRRRRISKPLYSTKTKPPEVFFRLN